MQIVRRVMAQLSPPRVLLGLVLLFLLGVVGLFLWQMRTVLDPAMIRTWLAGLGLAGPLALIAALAAVLVVPVIPASIFQIGSGLAFGPWWGLAYAVVADILGASTGFWLARRYSYILDRRLAPETQRRLRALAARVNWRLVVLLRLLPGPAYPIVSFAAGYSPLSYFRYILASLGGVLPALVVLVFAGDLFEQSPLLALVIVVALVAGLILAGRLLGVDRVEKGPTPRSTP